MAVTINGSTGISTPGMSSTGDVTLAGSGVELLNNSGRIVVGQTGSVIQVVQTVKTDTFSTTSSSFTDVTGMSVSITPSSTSSKILVIVDASTSSAASTTANTRLVRDSSPIYTGAAAGSRPLGLGQNYTPTDYGAMRTGGVFLDSPATTSAVTYKLQMLVSGGTQYLNRTTGDRDTATYDARGASSITVMEIAQ